MPTKGKYTNQLNPDFDKIIPLCIHELDIKFEQYGNSWLDMYRGYWDERLTNEIEEFKKALQPNARKRKLLNIINIAAMAHEADKGVNKPKVITLCGSTKFYEKYDEIMLKLTLAGWSVFTIGTHRFSDQELPEVIDKKDMLDQMHRDKIDISSCIFVVDVDGYIGESTSNEIMYAIDTKKKVYRLSRNELDQLL